MDELAEKERQKYERLWGLSDYDATYPSNLLTPVFLKYFHHRIKAKMSVIDFGCGSGKSAPYLLEAGLKVHLVDFCDNSLAPDIFLLSVGPNRKLDFFQACLWDLPESLQPADWILCFDVLEHIPESKVDTVLQAMASRMKQGGLLSIALREDVCGKLIGETLHLTVRPLEWWQKRVARHFSIDRELASHPELVVWAVLP